MSREILVAMLANIESREWRRTFNRDCQISAEHPRSSTTDDVECFFSVLRDAVGKDFSLKEVRPVHLAVIHVTMYYFVGIVLMAKGDD